MTHSITTEDLNAVRQLMRVFRALEKFEPLIQKVLTIDEETGNLQASRNTALKERDKINAEIEAARQKHKAELNSMADKKEATLQMVKEEIEATRRRLHKEVDQEEVQERKKLEEFRKKAAKEVADHAQAMEKKSHELQEVTKRIEEERRQKSALETLNIKLAETRDKHKKDIDKLLKSIAQSAAVEGI